MRKLFYKIIKNIMKKINPIADVIKIFLKILYSFVLDCLYSDKILKLITENIKLIPEIIKKIKEIKNVQFIFKIQL